MKPQQPHPLYHVPEDTKRGFNWPLLFGCLFSYAVWICVFWLAEYAIRGGR